MSVKVERGRTLARSQAMQLLFQAEAIDVPLEEVLEGDYLLSKGPLNPYARVLAVGAYASLAKIDDMLEHVMRNWTLDRLPGCDRNLLRIAVYEMRFARERIDDAIVINEAVEIAKAYGTDESARFVNGVLGRIASAPRPTASEPVAASSDGEDAPNASEPSHKLGRAPEALDADSAGA